MNHNNIQTLTFFFSLFLVQKSPLLQGNEEQSPVRKYSTDQEEENLQQAMLSIQNAENSSLLKTADKAELLNPNWALTSELVSQNFLEHASAITAVISSYNTSTGRWRKNTFVLHVKQLQLGWIGMDDEIRLIFIRQYLKHPMVHYFLKSIEHKNNWLYIYTENRCTSMLSFFHMPKDLDTGCRDCDFRWFSKGLCFVHLLCLSMSSPITIMTSWRFGSTWEISVGYFSGMHWKPNRLVFREFLSFIPVNVWGFKENVH